MEKYGFIYVWYDVWRKMYYIGCHWGHEDDGYICSSNRMRDAYRRRPQDFKRRVIRKNIPRESLLEEEHKWLLLIPDDEMGKKYYNLSKRHFGHWSTNLDTRNIRQKISDAGKGRIVSEETRAKMSASSKYRQSYLVLLNENSREKTRQKLIGRKQDAITVEKRTASIKAAQHKRELVECPKCHKIGPVNVMARWHFDKCAPKPTKEKPDKVIRGKHYEITYPDGRKEVILGLAHFCRINNISKTGLKRVMSGEYEHYRGYVCRKIKT